MTAVFREYIAQFVHVYLDNIFIYSLTLKEHEKHLAMVFNKLCEAQLYLSQDKVNLYSQRMDCLSHIILDKGIHTDANNMQKIRDWQQPHNFHNVQCFLGLIQYLVHFLPDITTYTSPLSLHTHNGKPFIWTPLLNKCFPILKPIDPKNTDTIWVICDSSKTGVSTVYGQGPDWQSCRPVGFLSKKLSSAQQNYHTHKHETIAILEALIKWEDKLLGRKFVIVTNHKSLEYFKTQPHLSSRHTRWWEYISHFIFTIQHVDGTDNRVADCLSCYFEADGPEDHHPDHDFMSANTKLDPDRELLPIQRYIELRLAAARRSHHLAEQKEQRVLNSNQMNALLHPPPVEESGDDLPLAIEAGVDGQSLCTHVERQVDLAHVKQRHYHVDPVFAKILVHPDAHQ